MKTIFLLCSSFFCIIFNAQSQSEKQLETVASFGKDMAIGVAISPTNRLFVSFPKRKENFLYSLTEIVNGKRRAFPDKDWNSDKKNTDACFINVQDLYADTKNNLWVLDSKPSSKGALAALNNDAKENTEGYFKIVKINLNTNKVERVYHLKGLDKTASGLNDLVVDTDKQLAYLSDPGQAAIVILNLQTDEVRIALAKTKYTLADTNTVLTYGDHQMRDANGKPFISNVNGIALTKDNRYFYFKPINCNNLYRIETKYLADKNITQSELESKIIAIPNVGITHGLVTDNKGNVYVSNSTIYSVRYINPDGEIHSLIKNSKILWPDSMGVGSDGYLYFSCSQLHLDATWNNGIDKRQLPYNIYRVKMN